MTKQTRKEQNKDSVIWEDLWKNEELIPNYLHMTKLAR